MIKNLFSDISKSKQTFDKITEIASKAKEYEQNKGREFTINGTIGMFKDENEHIFVPQIIKSLTSKFKIEELAPYSPMNGSKMFYKGIINLLNLQKYEKNIVIHPVSGGVTALHHIVHNFSDSIIMTHNPYWGPYKNVIEELGVKLNSINFFKDDLKSIDFENISKKLSNFQNTKILLIINNPSNNPTGNSFSENEWKTLKQILKTLEKKQNLTFILFFDLAYIDYSDYDFTSILNIFYDDFNIFAGFSISKSFSLYGFRTGAIIFFAKDKIDKEYVISKLNYSSRASTGSINTFGYKLIESFSDNSLIKILRNEQNYIKHIISKRSKLFIDFLNKFQIPYYRYDSGFFITFKPKIYDNFQNKYKEIDNFENLYFKFLLSFERKLEKLGIFFVPINEGIRVAICSLTLKKINLLIKIFENNKNKILKNNEN